MKRDKVTIKKPNRFKKINEKRIDLSVKLMKEGNARKKGIHHKTFKSATLRQIFKEKFILTRNEVDKIIYQTLSEHPEGLSFKQIQYFTGLGAKTSRIGLNRLRDKLISGHRGIFIRRLTPMIALYYAEKHSRKIVKQIKETEEKYVELENKLKDVEDGK